MNWLSKIRDLDPMENLYSILNLYLFSGGRQCSSRNGYFQGIKHMLKATSHQLQYQKLASVVEKRQFRRIEMKAYAFQKILSHQ